MIKKLALAAMISVMAVGSMAIAQDVVPVEGQVDIGAITADSPAYYGQTLTVQGNVDELVNIRSFVIGGGGIGNPQLLVLNNSGQEFNIGLTQGAEVRITGTIYPSYDEGGWNQVLDGVGMTTTDPMTGADTTGMDTTVTDPMLVTPMAEGDTTGMDTTVTDPMLVTPMPDTTGMDTTMTDPMTGANTTGMSLVGLGEYPVAIFTDRFPLHTILVINSIEDITFVITE